MTYAPPDGTLRAMATAAYARQSREVLEDGWILEYLPLVRHVVSKVTAALSHVTDIEDLISAGTLGLVKAARAFDPGKDAEFKTYAYIRIRGSVLDELRRRSFVPSSVHGEVRRIRQAFEQLLVETGSPPTDDQIAERLGIDVKQLYRTLQDARRQNFLSIHGLDEDEPALGTYLPAAPSPAPDAQAERGELLGRLAEAIAALPKRDRIVILLYYERDLTMKEVAAVLEVTESRVSQIHASALFRLSMKMRGTT